MSHMTFFNKKKHGAETRGWENIYFTFLPVLLVSIWALFWFQNELNSFIYIYIYIFISMLLAYIGMTCHCLEVRVRQHIPRSLLSGRLTSGHSQAMDSAIGEHLLTINSCGTSYKDDCFSVLHRARDKSHLKFLEAIYISMTRPSLCRQLNNHTLNIFGELLDTGVT